MRPDNRSPGNLVSSRPALAGNLEATFLHQAHSEPPNGGFADIPRTAPSDGIAPGAWVLSDKGENILIRHGHETISHKLETIIALLHLHFSPVQVFVLRFLQRYGPPTDLEATSPGRNDYAVEKHQVPPLQGLSLHNA